MDTQQRPQADDIRRPAPNVEQSGRATFAQEITGQPGLPGLPAEVVRARFGQPLPGAGGLPTAAQLSRTDTVLALQAHALAHQRFAAAATAVATELAQRLGCDRVSIGLRRGGQVRVEAMANTADIAAQQNAVLALAAAMDEAIDQACTLVHPLPQGSSPSVTQAHSQLARVNGQASICTVPIIERGAAIGAILCERRDAFDAHAVEVIQDAACFVGPVLELKHSLDQPLFTRMAAALTPRADRPGSFTLRPWHAGAPLCAVAALIVAFWPATFRVVAPARAEGAGQRVIAAQSDGYVRTVALRPGDPVKAGQLLVTLEDQDLALERNKWSTELSQLDKLYREALTKDDAAQIVIARSKIEQAQSQLELVQRQFERAQLISPVDGVLLSGDLSQSVGMPVKRGQELMTVAPDKSFRIVVEVDEQDIAALRQGQRARVLFAALSDAPLAVTVTRIAPVASAIDGRNVFEVDGRIDGPADGLRPGLRGIARIEIEPRSLGWVWWHRAGQWTERTLWRVLG